MANRRELSHFVLDFDMKTSIKVIQNVTLIAGYGMAIIGKHFIPFLKLLLLLWWMYLWKKEVKQPQTSNIVFGGQFKRSKPSLKPHFWLLLCSEVRPSRSKWRPDLEISGNSAWNVDQRALAMTRWHTLMCQKFLFGEKDVIELLQKEGQNVNQTISRARSLSKLTIKYYFWKDHDYILWKIGL